LLLSSSSNSADGGGSSQISTFSSFDFASAAAWEGHYAASAATATATTRTERRGIETADAAAAAAEGGGTATMDEEWHQEIALEEIVDLVERLLLRDDEDASTSTHNSAAGNDNNQGAILVIGCGTSTLPTMLLERLPTVRLVLLDSSRTCVEHVRERYNSNHHPLLTGSTSGSSAPSVGNRVDCVWGNVLRPRSTWQLVGGPNDNSDDDNDDRASIPTKVDLILDKGLMDVLLCGDDWDSTVPRLLAALADDDDDDDALAPTGRYCCYYVLVSYTLPPSTRQFIREETGNTWDWSFDAAVGDDRPVRTGRRSMVSLGRRIVAR
jgi:hypothetical protein